MNLVSLYSIFCLSYLFIWHLSVDMLKTCRTAKPLHFGTPFCSKGLGCQKPVRFGTLAVWCVQWRLALYVCAVNPSASWSWLCTTPSARDKVHRGFFVSRETPRDLRGSRSQKRLVVVCATPVLSCICGGAGLP